MSHLDTKNNAAHLWMFPWQPQICFRISNAARAAGGFPYEKIAHATWSKPINRLVNHRSRILVDTLANSFPNKIADERSTSGIKAAARYNSGSSVFVK